MKKEHIDEAIREFDALYQIGVKSGLNVWEHERFKLLEKIVIEEHFKLSGKEADYLTHLLAEAVRSRK